MSQKKTSEKLMEAFEKFRPHLNGHKTAINEFLDAVGEVEKMEFKIEKEDCSCTTKERCYGAYSICKKCGQYHGL